MKNGLKRSIFIIFVVFSAISGFFLISALMTWLERKMYTTAHTAVSNQRGSFLAEAEATAMALFRRFIASQDETDKE